MEVAERAGPDFPAVLDQPYALTLWTYYQLTERDRIRTLRQRIETVDAAVLTALAFNEPQKLTAEQQAAREAAKHTPQTKRVADDAFRAAADRLSTAVERGKLLED